MSSDLVVGAAVALPGVDASRGFTKRATKVISNAGLYQLVEDMARDLDGIKPQLAEIHSMCTRILARMTPP